MVKLILGIHNHQPVGNFGFVMEEAYEKAYLPFIEVLQKHPRIKASLHFSGILYDFFEEKHPYYLEMLKNMVLTGQVEILGGGYYEPVLALLPEADQRGQLKKMQDYVKARFGAAPQGAWLAERVWEPSMAGVMQGAGLNFTVLDDVHFFSSGLNRDQLDGYFTTEYDGRQLSVFPINQQLRYLIPFADPEKTIEYLRGFKDRGDCALVMADDGEKFGLWPETYELIYRKGWLDRFFHLLEENSSWLETETFSRYRADQPSKGLVYLPTTSYYELSQWALPPEAANALAALKNSLPENQHRFLRGAYFRNFISRYPESNRMYRKMLHVSKKVHALRDGVKVEMLDRLWMSQCNCGYWHGVFGGLYLPHIRSANYANMMAAENMLPDSGFTHFSEDWDGDERPEIMVESRAGNWTFSPFRGGALRQWDWRPGLTNWLNVLTRRKEAYHEKVASAVVDKGSGIAPGALMAKESGLEKKIVYDWHDRACLVDHFLHESVTPENFASAAYGEQGDFVTGAYDASVKKNSDGVLVEMRREGGVWFDTKAKVSVSKKVQLCHNGSWRVAYEIRNDDNTTREFRFGTELSFLFSKEAVCGTFAQEHVSKKVFNDDYYGRLSLEFTKPCGLWAFPLKTVSQSEGGFELTYQGSVILCHYKQSLSHGESFTFGFTVKASK